MNTWPKYAAGEYINSVEEKINTYTNPTPDKMINAILDCSNDRISGLIFRDAKGLFQIIYGSLPNGDKVKESIDDKSMINSAVKIRSLSSVEVNSSKEITTDADV